MISERILQKNLRALAKEHPEIAHRIEEAELPSGWYVFEARNGMPTLEVEHEGRRLSVHSRYDPEKEAISWCKAIPDDWDLLIIFGFGLGYHYEKLSSLFSDKEIIIVENDLKHLKLAFSSRDLAKSIRQCGFRMVVSGDPIWNSNEIMLNHMGKNIIFRALPVYEKIYSEFLLKMQANAKDLVRQHRSNIATLEYFRTQWLENYVKNAIEYFSSRPVKDYFNAFNNRPAIIVAAGPSLENNVHMLNELRDKALLIAAGSAIRVLEKHGVRPHLLVSFDGSEANYRHFEDFDAEGLPLVFAPIIHPRIIKEYKGPKIAIELDISPFIHWFNQKINWEPGMLISGPSVANVCFELAKNMGANPIILVGQDLAFTNLKTHADGAKHQQKIDVDNNAYIMVEDIYGKEIPTSHGFYSMKVWFEQHLRAIEGERVVIDATEGGAKIAGTEIQTLQEVAEKHLQESFQPQLILEKIMQKPLDLDIGKTIKELQLVVKDLLDQHELIKNYYGDCLEYSKQILVEIDKGAIKEDSIAKTLKYYRNLDARTTKLDYFQIFLKESVAPRFSSIDLTLGNRFKEEQDPVLKLKHLNDLYNAFFHEVKSFSDISKMYLKRLEQLLQEYISITDNLND